MLISPSLVTLFGGELKPRLLQALFGQADAGLHLRGLAAAAGVDSGNAHKALKALTAAGIVRTDRDARGAIYSIDGRSPLAEPLRLMFVRAGELMDDLRAAAATLDAQLVLVFGSLARGEDRPGSDVDVLVVGALSAIDAQAAFAPVARKYHRPVDVITVEHERLMRELAARSVFWHDIFGGDTIVLKGEGAHAAFVSASRR